MAVPGYRRKESDLKILKDSQFTLTSLIRLYKKNELVPKKFSKIVGEPMVENARLLMYAVNEANRCDLYKEYEFRKEQQRLVIKYANRILVDLLILSEFNGGNLSKFQKVITAVTSIPYTVKKWMKSDRERYEKSIKNLEIIELSSKMPMEVTDSQIDDKNMTLTETKDYDIDNFVSKIIKSHENDKIDERINECDEDKQMVDNLDCLDDELDNELENTQKRKKPTKQMRLMSKLLDVENGGLI